jgi:heme-degrading monooxygenase HmoA
MPPTGETEVAMIAVIFEVFPADGHKDDYLEHAARLSGELECMDGFISVERFQSLTDPDKLLSLSFRRDEEAVAGWRSRAGHRAAQSAGRKSSAKYAPGEDPLADQL